jgi:hypothetical protein
VTGRGREGDGNELQSVPRYWRSLGHPGYCAADWRAIPCVLESFIVRREMMASLLIQIRVSDEQK